MSRQLWLVDELRKAGLHVVEVAGWKTRGSETFVPIGVTWHATAGSRNSTALGEVDTILNGSVTAPPPIAQFMIFRDGTVYVCAAGRCNHNKIGWDGPNKGLGNTQLFGIEMANDNRGEPWPEVQLHAARRCTAVLFRKMGTDPLKRLAAHYEHQPWATRPPGEGSTKSDPFGIIMANERHRVANILKGDIMAKWTDTINITRDTGVELWQPDKPAGTEVEAAIILQLAGIHSARAARASAILPTLASKIDAISESLALLATKDFIDENALAHALVPLFPSGQLAEILRNGMTQEQIDSLIAELQQPAG
jgi:hypothetical protein